MQRKNPNYFFYNVFYLFLSIEKSRRRKGKVRNEGMNGEWGGPKGEQEREKWGFEGIKKKRKNLLEKEFH